MSWKCHSCGAEHDELPTCFGSDAPCFDMVPAEELDARVILSPDQCVVDETHFFIRGHIEIPIIGHREPLAFSVWSSLSRDSMRKMCERRDDADRAIDPPHFGWLCTQLSPYPTETHLPLSVQTAPPGKCPQFVVNADDHPLAVDQQNGITVQRWHEIVHQILHGKS